MIKIIVLKRCSLGNIGDIVNVKSGYARNYLIPYNKVIFADKENIKNFNKKNNSLCVKEKKSLSEIKFLYKKIKFLSPLIIKSKCSKNGRLFGSIKIKYIYKILSEKLNLKFSEKDFFLPKINIKNIGIYKINIFLYKVKKIDFIIKVISV